MTMDNSKPSATAHHAPGSNIAYLACPFTDADRSIELRRYRNATKAAARLMEYRGMVVFSPITHGHSVAAYLDGDKIHAWWMRQCMPFLEVADALFVLAIPGWRESRGVTLEIEAAHNWAKPVSMSTNGHSWQPMPPDTVQQALQRAAVVHETCGVVL